MLCFTDVNVVVRGGLDGGNGCCSYARRLFA